MWFRTVFLDIDSASAYRIVLGAFAKKVLLSRSATYASAFGEQYKQKMPTESEFVTAFQTHTVSESETSKILALLGEHRS